MTVPKYYMYVHILSYAGMLSKSKGQILRVAAVFHVLFHLHTPLNIPENISHRSVEAAAAFVDLCLQHAASLAGRGDICDAIQALQPGISVLVCGIFRV